MIRVPHLWPAVAAAAFTLACGRDEAREAAVPSAAVDTAASVAPPAPSMDTVMTADTAPASTPDIAAAPRPSVTQKPAAPPPVTPPVPPKPDTPTVRPNINPRPTAPPPQVPKPPAQPAQPAQPPQDTTTGTSPAPLRDAYHQAPKDTVSQAVYNGWKQFNLNCARCHGEDVLGTTIAPHLIVSLKPNGPINTKEAFHQVVCHGRPEKGMPAWCPLGLDNEKIEQLYAYVKARSDGQVGPGRPAVRQ